MGAGQCGYCASYSREALEIRVERSIGAQVVIETLADVMPLRGVPQHIRSDNGPEFTAKALRAWLATVLYLA